MRIANAKVPDETKIAVLEEDFFESWRQDVPFHNTFTSKEIHYYVSLSYLSERWQIRLGATTKTLKATTQRMLRSAIMPISRQYRDYSMFERPRIKGGIIIDTMAGCYKYLDGNRYAQVIANDSLFADTYPMEKNSLELRDFIADFGFIDCLVCDRYKGQISKGTDLTKEVLKQGIYLQVTKPDCYNQSKVEGVTREMRKNWFRVMLIKKVPHRLWDCGIRWVAEIM